MGIRSKIALGTLALAVACSPAVARQGNNQPAPSPPARSSNSGSGGQSGSQSGSRQMYVWVQHGHGRGWASWGHSHGMQNGGNMWNMAGPSFNDVLALSRSNRLDDVLRRAQMLLLDPQVRQQFGIDDQQATKLENQITSFRKSRIQDRANLDVQRIDLENLFSSQHPNASAINNKLQQLNSAQLALEKDTVDFALNVKQEITPQQRQKIREFLRQMHGNRWQAMQGRGWNGQGSQGRNRVPRGMKYQGSQKPNGSHSGWQNSQQQYQPQQSDQQGEPQGSTPNTTNQ